MNSTSAARIIQYISGNVPVWDNPFFFILIVVLLLVLGLRVKNSKCQKTDKGYLFVFSTAKDTKDEKVNVET